MTGVKVKNLAAESAEKALDEVYSCINNNQSFILEAGAGAGKTYSLIKALEYLIDKKGKALTLANQKIACITYTEIAKEQIEQRTDKHPSVHSNTIHSFCWSIIRSFQSDIKCFLPQIGKWNERFQEFGGDIDSQQVVYELGYPSVNEKEITLQHDDVISLMIKLLEKPKFRSVFLSLYPIVFIDEYQDTNSNLFEALKANFLDKENSPLFGFFGDHWQKIYGDGCGKISHPSLKPIDKNANFRSVRTIVNVLNEMRPELVQNAEDPDSEGVAIAFHTNNWVGVRRTEMHWKGDLPSDDARSHLKYLIGKLENEGWDFSLNKSKILMLTHNVLAEEQGYKNLANVFDRSESFIKKEDKYIAFFVEVVEPACEEYKKKHFGKMFSVLGTKRPVILAPSDKHTWKTDMEELISLRETGTVEDVLKFVREKKRPIWPEALEKKECEFERYSPVPGIEEEKWIGRLRELKKVKYSEVISVARFVNDYTPFSTKHGVKGAEFENVLVVVGRGWNNYNFDQMLTWFTSGVPAGKQDTFERSRNLFYVVCSRPKKRLALLFTQELSECSIVTLKRFFADKVETLDISI